MRVSNKGLFLPISLLYLYVGVAAAQQTVFNVPSGDVLDRGKVYGELDFTYMHSNDLAGFIPRIVIGVGRRVEVGLNVNGLSTAVELQTTLSPTVKWKAYDGGKNGWEFLVGDDVFLPVQYRTYHAGNYVWAEFAKTWNTKTRATFGAYHFTPNVVDAVQRAGGQLAVEQPLGNRVIIAADWYTGAQSLGYITPGIIVKLSSKFTWYGTYQVGNFGANNGNHQFLAELGWNFN